MKSPFSFPTVGNRFKQLAAFAVLATSLPAQAGTLEEIYNLAVQNDPQLGAAEAVFLSRNEVVTQSRAGLLPNVSIGANTTAFDRWLPGTGTPTDSFNDHAWQAVLTQPVFRLDSWYRFQQSKNVQAEAKANFAAEQQALLVRVAESYFAILQSEASLTSSNAARDAVQRQLEQVQQRFDVGLVAITDVLESQAAYDSATVTVIEAEGAQTTSFEPIVRLTGATYNEVFGLSEDFPVSMPEPQSEDAWVQMALENNYQLAAAREQVAAAERGVALARSGHAPSVTAQVAYAESVNGSVNLFGNEVHQRSAQLSLNVPIYQGGGVRSGVKQAGYDLQAAQESLDLTRRQIIESTRSLYSAIVTDVARVRATLRGIESSQSALDATQTGYEVGTRNIVDVLNAQRNLYASQFQYESARYQYVLDILRLKQAVGTLNPDDIYDLNRFIDPAIVVSRTSATTR